MGLNLKMVRLIYITATCLISFGKAAFHLSGICVCAYYADSGAMYTSTDQALLSVFSIETQCDSG